MTNCKECGEENCMAFAAKLVNRETTLDTCPPLLQDKYNDGYEKLWELLKPPIRELTIGTDNHTVKIGGKTVLHRHEFTYVNPTAIAIDVSDNMPEEELLSRLKEIESFSFDYIGLTLTLDMVAIRSVTNDPKKFGSTVQKVIENTSLPIILCSFEPEVIESGLIVAAKKRPLIFAANKNNWREMAEIALMYDCPLAVSSPNDLDMLRSLSKTILEYGVENIALDPGTFPDEGLVDTLNNFTMLRRGAITNADELIGFPLIGTPIVAWMESNTVPEVITWRETYLASMLITRYADLLIMHSNDGWSMLPTVIYRENIYTDPRKPVAVEPGLKSFGEPDENSPLLFTSNFALTYYTVAADIESGGINCWLLVVDTEGMSVESAVAGRKLTAEMVNEALKETKVEEKIQHKTLIIPGRAARISGELEEATGWRIMVGTIDSSEIAKFVKEKWPPKDE
jgi:acetyl-CoA decarbonylase/synthase complex subunit gamma